MTVSLNCLLSFHSKTVPVMFCFVSSALVRVPVAGPRPRGVVPACVPPTVLAEWLKGPPHCTLFTGFAFMACHHVGPGSQRPSGGSWSRSQRACHQGQAFHNRARETRGQLPRFLLNSPAHCRHASPAEMHPDSAPPRASLGADGSAGSRPEPRRPGPAQGRARQARGEAASCVLPAPWLTFSTT